MMAWEKVRFIGSLSKPVPGTDQLAVITAIYPVADGRAVFNRDRAVKLNRQVSDAASGIKLIRGDNGGGRAGFKT